MGGGKSFESCRRNESDGRAAENASGNRLYNQTIRREKINLQRWIKSFTREPPFLRRSTFQIDLRGGGGVA